LGVNLGGEALGGSPEKKSCEGNPKFMSQR
jgi:hypothetical protein